MSGVFLARDRMGEIIQVGDTVQVHLRWCLNQHHVGRVVAISLPFVYVELPQWAGPGGMFPENLTVLDAMDMDIGL